MSRNAPPEEKSPGTTDESTDVRERRAQWEAFEFQVVGEGKVRVRNESHDDPEDHSYNVDVKGQRATSCECPDHQYRDNRCKHMRAVDAHDALLEAASAFESRAMPDGGREAECEECEALPGEFPCASCAIRGDREIPE